jgi:hypothetical protein
MIAIIQHVNRRAEEEGIARKAAQYADFFYTPVTFRAIGISSHILPSSVRPARFFCTPPHCLKKKGTMARRH